MHFFIFFFTQAPGFPLLPFQHNDNYLQNFLSSVICAAASFYLMFFKLRAAQLGAVSTGAGATFLQGGHRKQPTWGMLYVCAADTAGSQDTAIQAHVWASEPELWQVGQLPGRFGLFLLCRLAAITCSGAVHMWAVQWDSWGNFCDHFSTQATGKGAGRGSRAFAFMTALIFSWPWREIINELSTCSQAAFFFQDVCTVEPTLINDYAGETANVNQTSFEDDIT